MLEDTHYYQLIAKELLHQSQEAKQDLIVKLKKKTRPCRPASLRVAEEKMGVNTKKSSNKKEIILKRRRNICQMTSRTGR